LFATIIVYVAGCIVLYFTMVQPWLDGASFIRMGADSDRYMTAAKEARENFSVGQFFGLSTNFLGPVVIGLVFPSGIAILGCNVLLFLIALKVAFSIEGIHKVLFGSLMLLNAELVPSLTTLNKEILAILAAVLSAKYIYSARPSAFLLTSTLVASFFARWEQLVIFGLFFLFLHSPLRRRPKWALGLLVAALTVIYPLMFRLLGVDTAMFDYLLEGAGLILRLDSIQAAFGFPIVLPIKVLMAMAGPLLQPGFYLSGEFLEVGISDFQQRIFQPLGCLALLIVFAIARYKGKARMTTPIGVLSAITLIIVAVAPFIQSRYVIPVYVLLSIELAKDSLPRMGQNEPLHLSPKPR
jgi:hypothetical protein